MRDKGIDEELHPLQRFSKNYVELFFEFDVLSRDFGNESGTVVRLIGDEVEEGQVENTLEKGFGAFGRLGRWSTESEL